MTIEWTTLPIGDICTIYDGPHATPKKTPTGPIFLGISNLSHGRLDLSDVEHLSEQDFARWTRRVAPRANDVVFSYETRLGAAALIPEGLRCCLGRRMGLLRPDTSKVDSRFLLYAYLGPQFQQVLRARTIHGSTVDRIPLIDLPSFPIHIPPLPIQRRIADILGALDDKIAVNRRIAATLEAMAQALFQHWFVDFGPFQGGSFVETELGMVPEGWHSGSILEQADLLSGGTPATSKTEYWGGGILWASAKDVSQCKETFLLSTERTITSLGLNNSATQIINKFSTIVVARGATTGRLVILADNIAMNQTCYALRSKYNTHFTLYCQIRQVIGELVQAAHGSVFDTITTSTFKAYRALLAPPQVLNQFEKQIKPIFMLFLKQVEQNHALATTRDYLLPKLLSGEVSVKVAEESVAEVL